MNKKLLFGLLTLSLLVVLLSQQALAVGSAPNSIDTISYFALEDLTDETNNYSLTNYGATSGATGIIDDAYDFDGSNDYMIGGFSAGFSTSSTVSFNVWLKGDTLSGVQIFLSNIRSSGGSDAFMFYFSNGNLILYFRDSDGDRISINTDDTTFNTGEWYMLTGVKSGNSASDLTIYVNNQPVSTTTFYDTSFDNAKWSPNSNWNTIGARNTDVNPDSPFNGIIDEVTIFDVALTADEVEYLYDSGSPSSAQQYPFTIISDEGNISFISQNPSDLDILNGFEDNVQISYNYTNISNQTGFALSGLNSSTNDDWPTDITFNYDSFYVLGEDGDEVNIYDSELNFLNTKSVSQDAFGEAIEYKDNKWYLLGDGSKKIYEYNSDFSYNSVNYNVNFDYIPTGTGAYYFDMLWNGTNWLLLSEGSPTNASIKNYIYVLNESFNYTGVNYTITDFSGVRGFDYNNGNYYFISTSADKIYLYNNSFDYQSEFYDLGSSKTWYSLYVEDERLFTVDRDDDLIKEFILEPILKYRVNSTVLDCITYVNGTCENPINTTFIRTPSSNNSVDVFNYTIFADNDLYPGSYNLPESSFISYTPSTYVLNSQGDGVIIEHLNISLDAEVEFLEVYANQTTTGTSDLRVYYCNSSYTTGKPLNSDSCTLLQELTSETNYSHCHTNSSCHYLIPIPSDASDKVNGVVDLTPTSYFPMIRTVGTGQWSVYYNPTVTRANASRTTTNSGNSYNTLSGTIDSHVHYYTGAETLYYSALGILNGTGISSSEQSDLIDLSAIIPSSVTIFNPISGQKVYDTLLINYSNVSFYDDSGYYNISLLNSNLSFNRTIIANNSMNTSYLWDVYKDNLSIDNYFIQVKAIDDLNGLSSISRSGNWSLETNALLNVSVNEFFSNDTINNFTIEYIHNETFSSSSLSTTSGYLLIPVIRSLNYTLTFSSDDYITTNTSIVPNDSLTNVSLTAFSAVDFQINFFNEETLEPINNVSFDVFSTAYSNSFNTGDSNNSYFFDDVPTGVYEIRYNTDNNSEYSRRSYFLQVPITNGDLNNISLYSVTNDLNQLFLRTITDTNSLPLEGYYIELQRPYVSDDNTSFTYRTVEIASVSSSGEAVFSAIPNVQKYRIRVLDSDFNIVQIRQPDYFVDLETELTVREDDEGLTSSFDTKQGINFDLRYDESSGFFVLDYSNAESATRVCLETVYAYKFNYSLSTVCSTDPLGTLTLGVDDTLPGRWKAVASVLIDGIYYPLDSEDLNDALFNNENFEYMALFIYFLLMILSASITGYAKPEVGISMAIIFSLAFGIGYLGMLKVESIVLGGILLVGGIVLYLYRRKDQ